MRKVALITDGWRRLFTYALIVYYVACTGGKLKIKKAENQREGRRSKFIYF